MDIDAAFNQARPLIGEPSNQTVEQHRAQLEELMRGATPSTASGPSPADTKPVYLGPSSAQRPPSAPQPSVPQPSIPQPVTSRTAVPRPSQSRPSTWPRSSSLSSSRAGRAFVGVAASVAILVGLLAAGNFVLRDRGSQGQSVAVGVEGASTPAPPDPDASEASSGGALPQTTAWSDELTSSRLVGRSADYADIFVASVIEGTSDEGCSAPLWSVQRVRPDGTSTEVIRDIHAVNGVIEGPAGVSAVVSRCSDNGLVTLVSNDGAAPVELSIPETWESSVEPFWNADGSLLWVPLYQTADTDPDADVFVDPEAGLASFDARTGELIDLTAEDHDVLGAFSDGTRVLHAATSVSIGDPNNVVVELSEGLAPPWVTMNADGTLAVIYGQGVSGFVVADSAGNRRFEGGGPDEVLAAAWSPDGHIASWAQSGGPIVITDGAGNVVDEIDVTIPDTYIENVEFFDGGRRLAAYGWDGVGQEHLRTVDLTAASTPVDTATTVPQGPTPEGTEVASAATPVSPTPTPGAGGTLPSSTPAPAATTAPAATIATVVPTSIPTFSEEPAATSDSKPTTAAEPAVDTGLPTGDPGTAEEIDPLNPGDYTNANIYYFPTNGGPAVSIAPLYPGDLDSGLNNGLVGVITYKGSPAVLVEHIEFVVGSEPAGTVELRVYRIEETGTTDYLVWDQRQMTGIDSTWFYTTGVEQHGDVLWVERGFQQGACYFVDAFDMDGNIIDDPDNPWPRPDLEALAADPSGPLCPSIAEVM